MNIPQIPLNFEALIPEIALTGFASLILLVGLFKIRNEILLWSSVLFLLVLTILIPSFEGKSFGEMFLNDFIAIYLKIIILAGTAISLLVLASYLKERLILLNESIALLLFSALGMMLMVSARELMSFFVSFELMSLSIYILAGIRRYDPRSNEAAIKYFMLGGLSTAIMLFGIAFIYGATNTTDFSDIINSISNYPMLSLIGLVLFIVGLCFKIAIVPFHMWAPDVYEGSPTPVTAFISTVPKVAVLGAFGRILIEIFKSYYFEWSSFLIVLSILTMAVGNLVALPQKNIKRMLAYSSIAHAGYIILGLIVGTQTGFNAVVVYMLIYTLMNIGAFAMVILFNEENIENYKGLHKFHPALALAMLIFMFSLTGVPPTAGFIVKFNIFLQAIKADLTWLVIVAVIFTVISAYYYLRIVMYIYMKEPVKMPQPVFSKELEIAVLVCVIGVTVLGVLPLFLI
ncbi:NADH-quinone oxidoreductase subunit N [Thermodesulfovibrio thiophilus]|uniref:NADH-quinone oxidoreductase subunit N n=1 Tax=Thermodesulfovibrio thiophilus TaxID=340095 RepID=UPI00183FBDC0|nr:NADH-quinone oxidoreductase subunit N [Thermodesulfovibrio thiophilus]HHW19696.1 NADH-quinone oxidoreductase subunit N [Thermodesulfovibrio thiophilus]